MNLQEFIEKYNGKHVEYDGVSPNQCVDLVKAYNQEVIGGSPLSGDAYTYTRNERPETYQYRKNDPLFNPPIGSVGIWNTKVGKGRGHLGIITHATLFSFVSFNQNWPEGSPSKLVNHNYKNVVGFLIPYGKGVVEKYNALVSELQNLSGKYHAVTA